MVIAFANNQPMTAIFGTTSVITTDPVPLGHNDRASAMLNTHYVFTQGGTATLSYQAQVSNDGTNWVDVTALTESVTTATTTPEQVVAAVNGAYLRFKFSLTIAAGSAGDIAGVGFDLHVNLDHV